MRRQTIKIKRFDDEELLKVHTESVELMRMLARSQLDEWNPYQIHNYAKAAAVFLILSLLCLHFDIGIGFVGKNMAYHREIIPSRALSYIDDGGQLIELPDGNYPVAMPSGGEAIMINGVRKFPLLMVFVPIADHFELRPLNIEDDSFLPRQGRTLALNILMGFTSAHAENTLQYDEKHGNVEDYKRKAYYYLEVKHGAGRMKRGYKKTRELNPISEMRTICELTNGSAVK